MTNHGSNQTYIIIINYFILEAEPVQTVIYKCMIMYTSLDAM